MLHLVLFQTSFSLSSDYVIVQKCSKPSAPSKFASSALRQINAPGLCPDSHENIFQPFIFDQPLNQNSLSKNFPFQFR